MFSDLAARMIGGRRAGLLLRLISESAWEHRHGYALALVMMALAAATGGAIAILMQRIMDDVFVGHAPGAVSAIAAWVLAVFLVRGGAAYLQTVLLGRIGNRVIARLQMRIHDHVMARDPSFLAREGTGALTTRITHNCAAARQALDLVATRLGADLLALLALLAVMLWQDTSMALVALVGLPLITGCVAWLVKRVRRLAQQEVTQQARVISALSETVAGARIIKAFRLESAMRARMESAVEGVRGRANRIVRLRGLVNPLMEASAGLIAGTVILYGGWRVTSGAMETGTFFAFVTALFLAIDPARRLAQLDVQLRQHLAAVELIFDLLDAPVATDRAGAVPLAVAGGLIRFEDVHFAYGNAPTLRGVDLEARPGQVTALVGPSGSGKSTVLALIERFHDPDAGRITIDGQDIRHVTLASLRDQIGLVTQETVLFDASVAENIGFGRPGATRAEIVAAAGAANAAGFIDRLPRGYDTPLGEGGARLSGGERQRIAIARAMLRDAPILLLDEATSALDAEAEVRVQEALDRLMAGRTTIVIAHRLATVRRAEQICVMVEGRVAERGTHDILVAHGGLYARLAALQFGLAEERR